MDKRLGTSVLPKVRNYFDTCRSRDLSFRRGADGREGDRGKRPSEQHNPDVYVRVVDRRKDGIVVRGAKAHTTASPFAGRTDRAPTRAMAEADADYAVAFAVPVATPGVKLIAGVSSLPGGNRFDLPGHHGSEDGGYGDGLRRRLRAVGEGFLCGEWQYAGALANAFVEFHRFTAASYKLPMCELFIGSPN